MSFMVQPKGGGDTLQIAAAFSPVCPIAGGLHNGLKQTSREDQDAAGNEQSSDKQC
jgi:hypothetical protein